MKIKHFYLLLILPIIGIIVLAIDIKSGIKISVDSMNYMTNAINLSNGHGLYDGAMRPLTQFPPLYPFVLALIMILGIQPLLGAALLTLIIFGINIFLIGFIIYYYTKSYWLSLLGSFFMLSSADMINIHSFAWSEPLFIVFILLNFFLLAKFLEKDLKIFLYFSAVAAALAWLDRYVGIVVIVVSVIVLLILNKQSLKTKITNTILFIIISCLPMALWLIRNIIVADKITNRQLLFHPISVLEIKDGFFVILSWFTTDNIVVNFFIGLMVFVLFVIVMCYKNKLQIFYKINNTVKKFLFINLIFILVYIIFLFFSASFFDASILLDHRLLAPIFPSLLMVILFLVYHLYQLFRQQKIIIMANMILFLCLFFVTIYIYNSINFIKNDVTAAMSVKNNNYHFNYFNFNSSERQNSIAIQIAKHLPGNTIIYSSNSNTLFWYTGKLSLRIPYKINILNQAINIDYFEQINDIKKKITMDTVFVVFKTETYESTREDLINILHLQLTQEDEFGAIYKSKNQ